MRRPRTYLLTLDDSPLDWSLLHARNETWHSIHDYAPKEQREDRAATRGIKLTAKGRAYLASMRAGVKA